LGISTISLIDRNCDPDLTDFSIPTNDDSITSICFILNKLVFAICEAAPPIPPSFQSKHCSCDVALVLWWCVRFPRSRDATILTPLMGLFPADVDNSNRCGDSCDSALLIGANTVKNDASGWSLHFMISGADTLFWFCSHDF
jgi:hypothetical protein